MMVVPLPLNFKIPQMEMYDGSWDLVDLLKNFKAHMSLHGFPREIDC